MRHYKIGKQKNEQTAKASKYPQKYFKMKPCKRCSTLFQPNSPSELLCSEKCRKESLSDRYLQRTYNISLERYLQMLEDQKHRCAICKTGGFVMKRCHEMKLVIDHCHKTGEVRGLLCHNCNRALGLLHDDRESLARAVEYLSKESATTIP